MLKYHFKGGSTLTGGIILNIYEEYLDIITQEIRLINPSNLTKTVFNERYVFYLANRVIEIAKNSTILRCCASIGHLTEDNVAYESVGAHTNLVRALVNIAIDAIYGWNNSTPDNPRRLLDEVALLHDLPENDSGDTPDNGSRDESFKNEAEKIYYSVFMRYYSLIDGCPHQDITRLLEEMRDKSSPDGRLLYVADKISAIIVELCYESLDIHPYAELGDENISGNNRLEMSLCDFGYKNGYLLSEMWTIDYLVVRKLTRYDDTGLFTALLVMVTLIIHRTWYSWREKQYD